MAPCRHHSTSLETCRPALRKPSAAKSLAELGAALLVDRELDELDAERRDALRERGGGAGAAPARPLDLVAGRDQRSPPVDRDLPRRAGAELVVEDLEREVAVDSRSPARRRGSRRRRGSPCPGMLRKCRLQERRSMSRSGASATCTRKMRSPGMRRIESGSILRASVWKESRIRPTAGWSARRTISQASRWSETCRPQASAS